MAMEKQGLEVDTASELKTALEKLEINEYNIVIADIRFSEDKLGGMTILKKTKQLYPNTEVILLTGFGSIETAVEAIKQGAFDYVEKGSGLLIPGVELRVQKALEYQKLICDLSEKGDKLTIHKREMVSQEELIQKEEVIFSEIRRRCNNENLWKDGLLDYEQYRKANPRIFLY
jgi:DNA-binding NtrC family response regulator